MSSYNYARYLAVAIESVLNQSFTDFELFIIDDASTDESWQIIQNYKDPRIKSFQNQTNQNSKYWMNKIIFELTNAEYFAVHHSDNIWEREKLQKQVNFLDKHPNIGAVFSNAKIIDENGNPLADKTSSFNHVFEQPNRNRYEWLNFFFYYGNALCHPSILIRRSCYDRCGGYRNGLVQIPDFDMWIRLCMAYEIHILSEKLIQYRVPSDGNFTSASNPKTRIRCQFELLQALDQYRSVANQADLIKIFPEAKQFLFESNPDYLYALGRLATDFSTSMVVKLFGLNLLFEALNDPERALNLDIYQKFNHKSFIELTAQHDIFSIETTRSNKPKTITTTQKEHLTKLTTEELHQRIVDLEQEILLYHRSKNWPLLKLLRRMVKFFKVHLN